MAAINAPIMAGKGRREAGASFVERFREAVGEDAWASIPEYLQIWIMTKAISVHLGLSTPPVVEEGRREAGELIDKLNELVELGHSASPGFIRQVAEDAILALTPVEGVGRRGMLVERLKEYRRDWHNRMGDVSVLDDAIIALEGAGEVPTGAIVNGREFLRRLAEHYTFECEAGSLAECYDYTEAVRCFEHMAEYIALSTPVAAQGDEVREALEIIFREWDARTDPDAEMLGWPDDPAAVMNDAWKNGFYDKAKSALATLGAPHEG